MYCDYEPSKAAVPKLFPTLPPLVTLYQTATPLFWGINQRCGAGPKLFDSGSGYKTPAPAPLRLHSGSSNMTFSDPVAARHSASSRALSAFRTPRPALGRLQVGAGDIFSGSGSGV